MLFVVDIKYASAVFVIEAVLCFNYRNKSTDVGEHAMCSETDKLKPIKTEDYSCQLQSDTRREQ
jgi:hypothetical protein